MTVIRGKFSVKLMLIVSFKTNNEADKQVNVVNKLEWYILSLFMGNLFELF